MPLSIRKIIPASRLRTKILLFIVVLAVVPVLALGALTLSLLSLYHRHNISSLEVQLIDQKIKEIEKFFVDTLGILEIRVGYTQKSEIEISQQLFLLENLLEENQAFEEVSFISMEGKETAKKSRGKGEIQLLDVSRLPKFVRVIEGESFISDVYHTLSGSAVTLSVPVRNRNDDIIQFLSAEVNLSQLATLIKNARLGTSGYLILVDQDGSLITQGSMGEAEPGLNLYFMSRVKRILNGETLNALKPSDRYESFVSGVPVVGAGKKIPELGWALLAEWPIADADAIISDVRNQVILFTIFGVVAVLLLTPFFADHLSRPVRKLKIRAQEIEKGNFEKRVVIKTKDELEDLGNAFNEMAKGLKRLQELKDEFVFIAAHELRAPVTVIRGYISMVMEGEAGSISPELKEMLLPVMKSGDGLNKLVDDLLEVARSEAGRIEVKVEPCDITEQIKSVLEELKILADEKSIKMTYQPQPDLPKVLADPDKLKEVIKNLIDNAIKYTIGKGTVTVTHEIKENMLFTHVRDTGIGIPKSKQRNLFQKFYRVKAKGTEEISGTGLGLWIIKQLVEKMQGKIRVQSEKGKGSTFSFSLQKA